MLKRALAVALLALPLFAFAQDKAEKSDKPLTAQQEKMGACNKEAGEKNLKGDERKKFMSECLKGGKKLTQQEKMKSCNKDAGEKNLKGDDRKKFMSDCLKGEAHG